MRKVFLAATVLVVASCATPEPTIQTGADAETTFDGLVAVDNSAFQRAWIDPTIDLSGYSKIMPGPATFEFRAVRGGSAPACADRAQRNFRSAKQISKG